MKTETLKKFAISCICVALVLFGLWLILKYCQGILFPLLVALLFSSIVRPVAKWLNSKTKIHKTIWSVLLLFILIGLFGWLCFTIGNIAYHEASDLVTRESDLTGDDSILNKVFSFFKNLQEGTGLFASGEIGEKLNEEIYQTVSDSISSIVSSVAQAITSNASSIIKNSGKVIAELVFCIIATFYLTLDFDGCKEGLLRLVPNSIKEHAKTFASTTIQALGRYIRAYISIMCVTFIELFVGLMIFRVRYAAIIALATTIIDIIPILGVGTVLIPWALICFIIGNPTLGIELLVLYGIIYVVRQVIEPKLVGSFVGIHPIVALIFVFFGFLNFGIGGMILAPIIAYVIQITMQKYDGQDLKTTEKRNKLFKK